MKIVQWKRSLKYSIISDDNFYIVCGIHQDRIYKNLSILIRDYLFKNKEVKSNDLIPLKLTSDIVVEIGSFDSNKELIKEFMEYLI